MFMNMFFFSFPVPLGCVRRWCPSRTLLSQRPPPHCRNGVCCGSSSMWSVTLYYSTSHSYENRTLSNKCETGSNITGISMGVGRKTAFAKRNFIHGCFICILLRGFVGIVFSVMFFFTSPNSTPGIARSASKRGEKPEMQSKHTVTAPLDICP